VIRSDVVGKLASPPAISIWPESDSEAVRKRRGSSSKNPRIGAVDEAISTPGGGWSRRFLPMVNSGGYGVFSGTWLMRSKDLTSHGWLGNTVPRRRSLEAS